HERSEIEAYEREHDYAALVGVYYLRGILGVYADLPYRAYPDFRRAATSAYTPTTLVDVPIIIFYWGCTAWRVGQVDDGRATLKKLRLWACEVPVNHEHRYLLVRAEKHLHYRRYRAAERDYRKSLARAVEREYIHEAALAAERLGDLLAERAEDHGSERLRGEAAAAFYHAYSMYTRWGAAVAAERVRKRLGWGESPTVVSPVLAEKAFVERLVGSESGDTAFRITLDELVRLSAADEGYLRASVGARVYLYRSRPTEEPEGTVARIEAGALPWHVSRLFEASENVSRGTAGGEEANALVLSSSAPAAVNVTVVLANRAQRERFSQVFAARAQSALLLAATVLGLRRLSETTDEQSVDLTVARQALVTARENQQRLLAALETALLLIDEHAAVLVANPAAEQYLEPSEGVERRLAPAIEEAVLSELGKPSGNQATDAVRRRGEHNARCGDAEHFSGERELAWNEQVLRLLITPTAAHTVVSIDDITIARRREQAFEQQRRELIVADRMSSLGMLAAATAHEVGNPNHILQLNLQSLLVVLERLETDNRQTHETIARAREFATQIGDASGRIEEVIRGIKEYGRSGRGHTRERQDPEAIAGRAVRFSRILASQYTDAFHYVPADKPLPELEVVPGLLEQALINLIKNACEALAERSQIVEVRTGVDTHTGQVVFSVCDQGRGLPAWAAAGRGRAFQSDKSEADGTGLGLSIVNSIVEQHHGGLEVTTAEGFTTVFELHVPSGAGSRLTPKSRRDG
ncbi:MAG: HAMP domain-containing sensor histidine kinase, partial [Spirochaetia bacterium]